MEALITRLKADHRQFLAILENVDRQADLRAAADPAVIKEAIAILAEGLRLHAELEDSQFFPDFRQRHPLPDDRFNDTFFAHLEAEHRGIEDYLQRLTETVAQSPLPFHWPQAYAMLARSLRSHFRKEEEQIFSEVR